MTITVIEVELLGKDLEVLVGHFLEEGKGARRQLEEEVVQDGAKTLTRNRLISATGTLAPAAAPHGEVAPITNFRMWHPALLMGPWYPPSTLNSSSSLSQSGMVIMIRP
jgi:hypothetical protein